MMGKVRHIPFSADEWIAGCQGLTVEEEGLYVRLVARIYSRGGALEVAGLATYCGCDPRKFARLLGELLAKGKVEIVGTSAGLRGEVGEKLAIHRCEVELKLARDRIEVGETLARERWKNKHIDDAAPHMRPRNANHKPETINYKDNPLSPPTRGARKRNGKNGHDTDQWGLASMTENELSARFNATKFGEPEHEAIRQLLHPGSSWAGI